MTSEIGLNRIMFPRADVSRFFDLAAAAGVRSVELRNDLPGKGIIDDLSPTAVVDLSEQKGIRIEAINALQQFNLPSHRDAAASELDRMIEIASSIRCQAIVFCPNNDRVDERSPEEAYDDTVESLEAFEGQLTGSGILGYVEPLGFPQSSLRSMRSAIRAISEAGATSYKTVYDTFHHHLGSDTVGWIEQEFDVSSIGIVHASGVPSSVATEVLLDEHRELIDESDRLGNLEQIVLLERLSYDGIVSPEPFSPRLAALTEEDIISAVRTCIAQLRR